jgi:chaperonin cofactor prefoldin
MERRKVEKRMNRLWRAVKKDLNRVSQDAARLASKGEVYIRDVSKKAEDNLEAMVLSVQRQKLYYELGKYLAGLSKSKWAESKKAEDFLLKIKRLGREIDKLKKD